jgi:predicted HTH domain antitoxin
VESNNTFTKVKLLNDDERVRSIAVMLSQNPPGEAALANARELMGGENDGQLFKAFLRRFVKKHSMPILISDDIIKQSDLSEQEFKTELALLLYEANLLNFGKARELSDLDVLAFMELLGQRKIEAPYTEDNFEKDLELSKQIRLRP